MSVRIEDKQALTNSIRTAGADGLWQTRELSQLSQVFAAAMARVSVTDEARDLGEERVRVAEELVSSHPDLAAEFDLLTAELRVGVEMDEALRNLADRNGLDDIRGFAALLSQSMRFGTSVGETLRVYANEFREKRMQKAEEAAGKLSVKMLFPMVVCIFPAFFVVAIGPAVLALIEVFSD